MNEKRIPFTGEEKYLGLYLDMKLMQGPHLKTQCMKVLCIFMQCSSAVRTVGGLIALRSDTETVADLAVLIWWKTTENITLRGVLDNVKAVILKGVDAFKGSTPRAAIKMLLYVHSLDLDIKSATRPGKAYRRRAADIEISHATIQRKMLGEAIFNAPQNRMHRNLQFRQRS